MALLAGPKRKQKLGFDPNNTSWAKDTSAVGQSLLKKMGWKEGAGLGANEDGIVVPVKATMKSDNRGLGCTAQQADAWIAHQEEFDQILASLNGTAEKEDNANNSSQNESNSDAKENKEEGQKRFYGRFSRGGVKQLRTTDDLNCILGRRKSSKKSKTETKEKTPKKKADYETDNNKPEDETEKNHGFVTVTSNCSVQDYFAQKMKNKNLPPVLHKNSNDDSKSTNDIEEPTKQTESFASGGCTVQDYFAQKMKAKKAKLAKEKVENSSETGFEICGEETSKKINYDKMSEVKDDVSSTKSKKKKKKRKSGYAEEDDVKNLSSDVEIVELVSVKEKGSKKRQTAYVECKEVEIINDISSDDGKRRSKKLKSDPMQNCSNGSILISSESEAGEKLSKNKDKGKRKKKNLKDKNHKKESCDEDDVKVVIEEDNDVEIIELDNKQDKKKRKRKMFDNESEIVDMTAEDDLSFAKMKNKKFKQNGDSENEDKNGVENDENEKLKQSSKKVDGIKVQDQQYLKMVQKRKQAITLSAASKEELAKAKIMKELQNLSIFNLDFFWSDIKHIYQTSSFSQLMKDLRCKLRPKIIEKQDEKSEGDKMKVCKEIRKLKTLAIKEATKINCKMCDKAESAQLLAIKKLKNKHKIRILKTNELVTKTGDKFGIDLSKQLELLKASFESNRCQVKKSVKDTIDHLNETLTELKKDIQEIEDVVATIEEQKQPPTGISTGIFPGAVEVKGYCFLTK